MVEFDWLVSTYVFLLQFHHRVVVPVLSGSAGGWNMYMCKSATSSVRRIWYRFVRVYGVVLLFPIPLIIVLVFYVAYVASYGMYDSRS
jgi:hypothetical protein